MYDSVIHCAFSLALWCPIVTIRLICVRVASIVDSADAILQLRRSPSGPRVNGLADFEFPNLKLVFKEF